MDPTVLGLMPLDIIVSLGGSLLAGSLIGLEREFRGRPAGLRTHALVCLASALLMLAAARQGAWDVQFIPGEDIVTDPTRMAHGILTGIGFLCAGVIFREGFSVQGLTTASSLWMTSALGILFGIGMHELAFGGTAITLGILVAFRLLYGILPPRVTADMMVRGHADLTIASIRALLADERLTIDHASVRFIDGGTAVEHNLKLTGKRAFDLDTLSSRLRSVPGITELTIVPHEDSRSHA